MREPKGALQASVFGNDEQDGLGQSSRGQRKSDLIECCASGFDHIVGGKDLGAASARRNFNQRLVLVFEGDELAQTVLVDGRGRLACTTVSGGRRALSIGGDGAG